MARAQDITRLAKKAYKLGYEYEGTYRGCGQCTIAALQDTLKLRDDNVFKAATAFAGSTGMLCDAGCGAYSGGSMFISSTLGRERNNFADPEKIRMKTHALVRKLHDRFIAEYGTVICRDIHTRKLGRFFYLPDSEEYAKFDEAGAHATVCTSVVGNACRWVIEILGEEGLIPERSLKKINSHRGL